MMNCISNNTPLHWNRTATFTVAAVFNELEASHVLTPMLIMEVSTIVLAVLRADFLSPMMQIIAQFSFVVLFFVSRLVVFPYVYYEAIGHSSVDTYCFPRFLFYLCLGFGAFFHCLNLFCKFRKVACEHA